MSVARQVACSAGSDVARPCAQVARVGKARNVQIQRVIAFPRHRRIYRCGGRQVETRAEGVAGAAARACMRGVPAEPGERVAVVVVACRHAVSRCGRKVAGRRRHAARACMQCRRC